MSDLETIKEIEKLNTSNITDNQKHLTIGATLTLEICQLIDESRQFVAQNINSALSMLYWKIGKRINNEILNNQRAEYGKQIVASLVRQLTDEYGKSYSEKNIRRMMQFAECFPDEQIVAPLMRQLTWTHFTLLLPLKQPLQREFYAEMCRIEKWSVRTLRQKIDSMLFERTAISQKPDELIKNELENLRTDDKLTPDLVFRNPYLLDFLNLNQTYFEKDLETAIVLQLEQFILELGVGFTFVERQKRMIIDGEDFKLDLLFYHRKLRRLVAIDLKIGQFKAAYKGQMELYLRYLEKYETEPNEDSPLGLILCSEGSKEQIELLQLDKTGIRVAEYLTTLPTKELLEQKLRKSVEIAKLQIENFNNNKL